MWGHNDPGIHGIKLALTNGLLCSWAWATLHLRPTQTFSTSQGVWSSLGPSELRSLACGRSSTLWAAAWMSASGFDYLSMSYDGSHACSGAC